MSDRNINMPKWLLVSFILFLLRIRSILDIVRSEGVEDASTARYFVASFANRGYNWSRELHQISGSISVLAFFSHLAARLHGSPSADVVPLWWPEDYWCPPLLGPTSTAINVDKIRNAVIIFTFLLYEYGSPFQYIQCDKQDQLHHATSIARRTKWDLLRNLTETSFILCACSSFQLSQALLAINVRGCSLRFCYVFGSSLSITRLIPTISVSWSTERPSRPEICPTLGRTDGRSDGQSWS